MDNRVQLFGTVAEPPTFSHAIGANRLYRCELEVPRLSGVLDRVPLLLPERLEPSMRGRVGVLGQLRGYSRQEEGRRRLRLMVLVKALLDGPAEVNNLVELRAQLLRPPTYRKTPMGREIADLLLRAEREPGRRGLHSRHRLGRLRPLCPDTGKGAVVAAARQNPKQALYEATGERKYLRTHCI